MGILFGAVVAIALFLHRRMRPRGEILGQHPDGVLGGRNAHDLAPISQNVVPERIFRSKEQTLKTLLDQYG